MTQFDFDTEFSRDGTSAEKHEEYKAYNAIPMWVADTDFKSPPVVQEALIKRIQHGAFGYTGPSPELVQATSEWLKDKYDWLIDPEWIVWLPGVVPGFNLSIQTLTDSGDAVAVQTPNYPPLRNAASKNQRTPLYVDSIDVEGRWELDFSQLEEHFKKPECKLFILCNPMNPCGSRLTEAELNRIVDLAKENQVALCSDEIHCDLLLDSNTRHIPIGKLYPDAITLMAASKTFNIAGLSCSFAIIPNKATRLRLQHIAKGLVSTPNLLGFTATEASFIGGQEWLEAQMDYLRGNLEFLQKFLTQIPEMKMLTPEATFLAWIDCTALGLSDPFQHFLDNGVALSDGKHFGKPGFIRLNFGCPRSQLKAALERMKEALTVEA